MWWWFVLSYIIHTVYVYYIKLYYDELCSVPLMVGENDCAPFVRASVFCDPKWSKDLFVSFFTF
jgi:hypothetical protein